MDLTKIEMAEADAEAAFQEYRAAFMAERNRVDGELMRGYKALRQGKALIRLSEAITAGGENERHLPKLAIARADERLIEVQRSADGSVSYSPGWNIRARDRVIDFPRGTLPEIDWGNAPGRGWSALVPIIPPRFRPPHALTGFHVLWEAKWTQQRARAPHDPALLKHIGGDLWAVLAVWDLTDLERAVLEMR